MSIELEEEHPNWSMYFDGAINIHGNEIGDVPISPKLSFPDGCANFLAPKTMQYMKHVLWA